MQPGFAHSGAQKEEAFLQLWGLSHRYLFISKWTYLFLDSCSQARKCWLALCKHTDMLWILILPWLSTQIQKRSTPTLACAGRDDFVLLISAVKIKGSSRSALLGPAPRCHQLFAAAVPFNSAGRQLSPLLLSAEFSLVRPGTQLSLLGAHSCTSQALSGTCLVS